MIDCTLTTAGRAAILSAVSGKTLTFTGFQVGDGTLAESDDPASMTALKHKLFDIEIKDFQKDGEKATLSGAFTSKDVATPFYYREIALFGTISNDTATPTPVLIAYGNAGQAAELICKYTDANDGQESFTEKLVRMTIAIGQAEHLTAVIEAGTYVTKKYVDDKDAARKQYVDDKDAALTLKINKKANDTDVLHKAGRETFTDPKIYKGTSPYGLLQVVPGSNQGVVPTAREAMQIGILNAETAKGGGSGWVAYLIGERTTDGRTRAFLQTCRNLTDDSSPIYAYIGVEVDANGQKHVYTDTPPLDNNSGDVATTAWVNQKFPLVSTLPASPNANLTYFLPEE